VSQCSLELFGTDILILSYLFKNNSKLSDHFATSHCQRPLFFTTCVDTGDQNLPDACCWLVANFGTGIKFNDLLGSFQLSEGLKR